MCLLVYLICCFLLFFFFFVCVCFPNKTNEMKMTTRNDWSGLVDEISCVSKEFSAWQAKKYMVQVAWASEVSIEWTGQDWISCRILAIFLDQDWIWIFIFDKNWNRTGSGYLFDFYNEIFLRVIQDVLIRGFLTSGKFPTPQCEILSDLMQWEIVLLQYLRKEI